tara:strand:- start:55 stop:270 length:216 start_codon:yes stop_codon:yes gene_type:complete
MIYLVTWTELDFGNRFEFVGTKKEAAKTLASLKRGPGSVGVDVIYPIEEVETPKTKREVLSLLNRCLQLGN